MCVVRYVGEGVHLCIMLDLRLLRHGFLPPPQPFYIWFQFISFLLGGGGESCVWIRLGIWVL